MGLLENHGLTMADAPDFEAGEKLTAIQKAKRAATEQCSQKKMRAYASLTEKYNLVIDFNQFFGAEDTLEEYLSEILKDEDPKYASKAIAFAKAILQNYVPETPVGVNGTVEGTVGVVETPDTQDVIPVEETILTDEEREMLSKIENYFSDDAEDTLVPSETETMDGLTEPVYETIGFSMADREISVKVDTRYERRPLVKSAIPA